MNYYHNPVKTYTGTGSINNISKILNNLNLKNNEILILHRGNDFPSTSEYKNILDNLNNYIVHSYDYTQSNPSLDDVITIKNLTDKHDYSAIIAIGGGSVIDMAKALKATKNIALLNSEDFKNVLISKSYEDNKQDCSLIAVPTTSGTGSEVTPFASMWDKVENKKYSLSGPTVYAEAAIIDATLITKLPLNICISTSLDALCHAVEAYWSKNTNTISRMYSLKAIKLITNSISKIVDDSDNLDLRENLLMASFFAGLSFSNTKTTSCHSISYPLTMMYKIPHGIATFLTLSSMYEINKDTIIEIDELYKAFGTDEISKKFNQYLKKTGISLKLSDYGVKKEDIKELISKSFTKGRMDNNPIKITKTMLTDALINIM